MFIINAPFAFRALWKIIKPLLAKSTLEKISILGGDYVPKMVAKGVPLSSLPPWMGDDRHGWGTFAGGVALADVVLGAGAASPLSAAYAGPVLLADP